MNINRVRENLFSVFSVFVLFQNVTLNRFLGTILSGFFSSFSTTPKRIVQGSSRSLNIWNQARDDQFQNSTSQFCFKLKGPFSSIKESCLHFFPLFSTFSVYQDFWYKIFASSMFCCKLESNRLVYVTSLSAQAKYNLFQSINSKY